MLVGFVFICSILISQCHPTSTTDLNEKYFDESFLSSTSLVQRFLNGVDNFKHFIGEKLIHRDYPENVEQFRFKNVVIFGDSYSDDGNAYRVSKHKWPLVPPYYRGRFCNGPIWTDQLKVPGVLNYAYGGATTDNNFVQGSTAINTVKVPGVRQQIEMYFNQSNSNKIDFARTLYIIWAGSNDFLFQPTLTPTKIIASLLNGVQDLLKLGAKNFLIFNQIPAQYVPNLQGFAPANVLSELTNASNVALVTGIKEIQQKNSQTLLNIFDITSIISKAVQSKSDYFKNTTANCWNPVNLTTVLNFCGNPEKFVFLDTLHLTSRMHGLIADAIRQFLLTSFEVNSSGYYIH
ncbi:unnamed protein product [Rotaria magnacalcarata]|uniref:Uncharacterized protein n=1 Tax=Rotaria magnacalcarata TaxID=392030 RepID=A0A816L1D0_9BILA|nr:unnamed protein product [Rotaria magnacalcarata]